jgi:hypothetical protein
MSEDRLSERSTNDAGDKTSPPPKPKPGTMEIVIESAARHRRFAVNLRNCGSTPVHDPSIRVVGLGAARFTGRLECDDRIEVPTGAITWEARDAHDKLACAAEALIEFADETGALYGYRGHITRSPAKGSRVEYVINAAEVAASIRERSI